MDLETPPEAGRMPADERRTVIALAAGRLFARHGYSGTRLEDIAAAARVTKPIVYRHFESKKALYLALLAKHREDLPSFFVHAQSSAADSSASAAARAILEHWFDYVRANQHAWVMLFRDTSGDDEIQAYRRGVSVRAREVIAEFVAERAGPELPAEQVGPTAELLTSGLAGLALWWIDHPQVPKPVVLEVATRFSAVALAPSPSGG